MNTKSADARNTARIEGTLHVPRNAGSAPSRQDTDMDRENARESEVAGLREAADQTDRKGKPQGNI